MENLEPRSLTDLPPDLLALIYKKLTTRGDRKSLFQCTKAMRVPQVGCFSCDCAFSSACMRRFCLLNWMCLLMDLGLSGLIAVSVYLQVFELIKKTTMWMGGPQPTYEVMPTFSNFSLEPAFSLAPIVSKEPIPSMPQVMFSWYWERQGRPCSLSGVLNCAKIP